MAPTPLNPTQRYISPEVTKYYWVPTVATLGSPTRAELDAGTDLSGEVAAATNWTVSADRVTVPDLGTRKTGRISGRVNPGDAQIAFYASQDTQDVRDLLHRGDVGNVAILYGGDVAGQKMQTFAVEVSAVSTTADVAGTEGERVMVDFSVTDFEEDVVVPT